MTRTTACPCPSQPHTVSIFICLCHWRSTWSVCAHQGSISLWVVKLLQLISTLLSWLSDLENKAVNAATWSPLLAAYCVELHVLVLLTSFLLTYSEIPGPTQL